MKTVGLHKKCCAKAPTLKNFRSLLHRPQEVWWFRHVSHTHWLSLQSPMQFDLLSFLFQYQHLHSASSAPTQGHHSWQPHGWDKGSRQTSSLHHVQCASSWIHWPGQRIVSTYAVSSDHGLDHMSAPPLHIQKTGWLRDRRKYLFGNSHSQKHKRFLSRKSWAEVMLPERSCGVATWRFSGRELEWQAISWLQTPWRGGKKQKRWNGTVDIMPSLSRNSINLWWSKYKTVYIQCDMYIYIHVSCMFLFCWQMVSLTWYKLFQSPRCSGSTACIVRRRTQIVFWCILYPLFHWDHDTNPWIYDNMYIYIYYIYVYILCIYIYIHVIIGTKIWLMYLVCKSFQKVQSCEHHLL